MIEEFKEQVKKIVHHLEKELAKIQVGRASPSLLEDIQVEVYGIHQPIKNITSIQVLDNQTLSLQPWDKTQIHLIAKALAESELELNPQKSWDAIIIKIPPLTEERRKNFVKYIKKIGEDAKIQLRTLRQEHIKHIKHAKEQKEITEDDMFFFQKEIQNIVEEAQETIEKTLAKKEADLMKV